MATSRTVFASAARTATANSNNMSLPDAVGAEFMLDISAVSGTTPTCVVKVQARDPISGNYVDVPGAAFASQNATGTTRLVVHPAITASANVAVAQTLPERFRAVATIGGTTPSFTFSLSVRPLKS